MADWIKILIGSIAGFVFGLLAEPLKRWIGDLYQARQFRNSIYRELALNYHVVCEALDAIEDENAAVKEAAHSLLEGISTKVYSSAAEQPLVIQRIPEVEWLDAVYVLLNRLSSGDPSQEVRTVQLKRIKKEIDDVLLFTTIRRRKMLPHLRNRYYQGRVSSGHRSSRSVSSANRSTCLVLLAGLVIGLGWIITALVRWLLK